ncbi:MAG: Gfo/Idh/MocA family protein [Opitutaceae bacterium]
MRNVETLRDVVSAQSPLIGIEPSAILSFRDECVDLVPPSLKDAAALIRVHRKSGLQAAVAYVYHVCPFLSEARRFLAKGSLGPVLHATARSGQPFHLFRPAYARTYYNHRKTGGGAIQDALTHVANWIGSVPGPTGSVLCDCAHLALPGVTVEDTVHLTARNGPALAGYFLNQFQQPKESTLQFDTAGGSVKIEVHNERWGVFRAGDDDWTRHGGPVPDRDVHFTAQADAFPDQIEGRSAPACSLESAAQTLRFNLAALASAESGSRVHCASLPPSPDRSRQ